MKLTSPQPWFIAQVARASFLTGPEGALPIIPTHWGTFPTMRKPGIEGWTNLLDQYDFTEVTIAEE